MTHPANITVTASESTTAETDNLVSDSQPIAQGGGFEGTITGTVTKEVGGAAVSGAIIRVFSTSPPMTASRPVPRWLMGDEAAGLSVNVETGVQVDEAITNSSGEYEATGISPSRSYLVLFIPPKGSNLLPQYWQNKPRLSEAKAVPVEGTSSSKNINAALAAGGEISGTVEEGNVVEAESPPGEHPGEHPIVKSIVPTGPAVGVTVKAFNSAGTGIADDDAQGTPTQERYENGEDRVDMYVSAETTTNSEGKYTLKGLASGNYTVIFSGGNIQPAQYEVT